VRALITLGLLGALTSLASGCTHVEPWERNLLARPDMAWEVDDVTATQENHTYFAKEAAMPGGGVGGGGCGCN
jgi:hypothetical protein